LSDRLAGQDRDDERTPEQRWRSAERMYYLDIEMSRIGLRVMRQAGLRAIAERAREAQTGKSP
jgi:hypothetical protein